jgi:hypothetical protein
MGSFKERFLECSKQIQQSGGRTLNESITRKDIPLDQEYGYLTHAFVNAVEHQVVNLFDQSPEYGANLRTDDFGPRGEPKKYSLRITLWKKDATTLNVYARAYSDNEEKEIRFELDIDSSVRTIAQSVFDKLDEKLQFG